jgi:hypothetical protein
MVEIQCPECGEKGCDKCDDRGFIPLTSCPNRMVSSELRQVIRLADFYEKGLPPVAGGALDQSNRFIEACEFLWGEQAHLKRVTGKA